MFSQKTSESGEMNEQVRYRDAAASYHFFTNFFYKADVFSSLRDAIV